MAWIDPDIQDDDDFTTDQVRELSFDGSHSRIVWQRPRDVVFGWIPADALYVLEVGEPDGVDDGEEMVVGVLNGVASNAESGLWRCREALPLFASVTDGPPPSRWGPCAQGSPSPCWTKTKG